MTRGGSGTGSLVHVGIFADTTIMHVQRAEGYVYLSGLCRESQKAALGAGQ